VDRVNKRVRHEFGTIHDPRLHGCLRHSCGKCTNGIVRHRSVPLWPAWVRVQLHSLPLTGFVLSPRYLRSASRGGAPGYALRETQHQFEGPDSSTADKSVSGIPAVSLGTGVNS
jgi:hypothetical protein